MFDRIKNHEFIVVGMEHYNPLGLIRTLGQNGIDPIYIAIRHKCKLASASKYVSKVHFVESAQDAFNLLVNKYGNLPEKPFVLTTDDDIQSLIDLHWDNLKDRIIAFNCGKAGRTTEFMDKKEILDCAERNGLKILKTVVVDRGDVPNDVEYPIITKSISPSDGGWKNDVFICQDADELKNAFKYIKSERVLIQHYIDKANEICIDGYSVDRGSQTFMPMYTTYNYNLPGYYSPYMTAHTYDLPELDKGIKNMFEEIGFEGIFSAEFLVDQDGTAYFTEINFRNSTWSYIATKLEMPLACLWAESMLTTSIPAKNYKSVPNNYKAMVEPIDYQKRVVEGGTSLSQWVIDFKAVECPFYLDVDDPRPFEVMLENRELLS